MTSDDIGRKEEQAAAPTGNGSFRHLPWLKLPAPIKAVFDRFPLITYDRNELPSARAGPARSHTLYVFTTEPDARAGAPSYNPTCLKWQAYLRFRGTRFEICPSTNHASPTGALPFLIPASPDAAKRVPIPSRQIESWTERTRGSANEETSKDSNGSTTKEKKTDVDDMRYEAYISLLDHRIRNAYLYTLYICTPNFNAITKPLYIDSTTFSSSVRLAQAHQLRKVARSELAKQSGPIDADIIHRECESAFDALSILLGDSTYFFGQTQPGLLDAALFGYTNLLLNERLQWKVTSVRDGLSNYPNLVGHRDRILKNFFSVS